MNVSLVMFTAEGDRRDFAVTRSRNVIGRQNDCDLRIPLASVSRQHCELTFEDGQVLLRDLGSSNGTYHNNSRIQSAHLSAGDEVVVGPVIFTVVIDGYPSDIKPVRSVLSEGSDAEAGSTRSGSPAEPAGTPGSAEPAQSNGDLDVAEPAQPTGAQHLAEDATGGADGQQPFSEDDALSVLGDDLDEDEADELPSVEPRSNEQQHQGQQSGVSRGE